MSPVTITIIALIIAGLIVIFGLVGARASKLARELESTERKLASKQGEARTLAVRLAAAEEDDRKKIGWLDHQEQEITWLRAELETRPKITRKTYRILTLGMKATGKTSLTLKWSNPLIDLGMLEGTKIERYERTVSHVGQKDLVTEHVFEVRDWGGEHIVDAQQELIMEEIHGLLIVVDLGGKDARQMDTARIHEQLQEFQPQALQYFFVPKMVTSCKTVVLFINKSDLLPGTPAQVEEQAKKLYASLIEILNKYSTQIDVRVFVGSASYGHSTHLLFSHFVERILPKNAYDAQLLQRMTQDFAATPAQTHAEQPPPAPPAARVQPPSAPPAARVQPPPAPRAARVQPPALPVAGWEAAAVSAKTTVPMLTLQKPTLQQRG